MPRLLFIIAHAMSLIQTLQARSLFKRASAAHKKGDHARAMELYERLLPLWPDDATTLFNLGMLHKLHKNWPQAREYNARAVALDPGSIPAHWNLAVAATALRDWATARACWQHIGLEVEPGDGPVKGNFGATPVRLNPDSQGEVVWSERIDPVRARITSIPFPASGFRYGDVVLHDAAPAGERVASGRTYYVFDVFERFEQSSFQTVEVRLEAPTDADVEALAGLCEERGLGFEDWSTSVRYLCRACSEGRAHEQHDHEHEAPGTSERNVAIAATTPGEVDAVLAAWRSEARWPLLVHPNA